MAAAPAQPEAITGTDALVRCLTILDKVEDTNPDDYNGELHPRARVIRALAAFYDCLPTMPVDHQKPEDQR